MAKDHLVRELGSLVDFLRYEQDPWGVKDLESRFIYANNFSHLGIKMNFRIEGIFDSELPHPVAEISENLLIHDKNVITSDKKECVIQTCFNYNEKEYLSYLFEKRPFYNKEGEIKGVIYHGRKFCLLEKHHLWGKKFDASVCRFSPPNNLFSKKECLIIYWLMQRFPSKEIAKKLNISYRTVENRISIIYSKAGVSNCTMFIDYCVAAGFNNYIPFELVKPYMPLHMD